jgi:hypothetical protein
VVPTENVIHSETQEAPVTIHYKLQPGVKDGEGVKDLSVDISTGDKTSFVIGMEENQNGDRKYKAGMRWKF